MNSAADLAQRELEEIDAAKLKAPEDPVPVPPGLSRTLQEQLDSLTDKVDVCLSEILNVKVLTTKLPSNDKPTGGWSTPQNPCDQLVQQPGAASSSKKKSAKLQWSENGEEEALRETARHSSEDAPHSGAATSMPVQRRSEWPTKAPKTTIRQNTAGSDSPPEKALHHVVSQKGPRQAIVAGGVDLQVAWKLHAKRITQQDPTLELSPMLRLVHRSWMETAWEFLDDPDSSRGAWWACLFQKLIVCIALLFSCLQVTKEPLMDPLNFALWETALDILFLSEFLARIICTPLRRTYVLDPLNWADMLSVCALPLRIAAGFVLYDPLSEDVLVRILMFVVPLIRFLKLLRYFEIFRLLIDAFKNSATALPVLAYIMALITLFGATGIYLAEEKAKWLWLSLGNIPYFQQAMWLAIVTMTSVGYGDFYPETLAGYIVVSMLTFVSVLFLAMPVGIIGYEFTCCWQSRDRVLLITKVRKCLEKWGYSAKDVRILFDYVDANGDGDLNLSEFIELIRQMRIGISVESAFDLFTLFDDDNNGTLDATEFLRHIFPEQYVKDQQEKQTPPRKSRAVVGEALQHLEKIQDSHENSAEHF